MTLNRTPHPGPVIALDVGGTRVKSSCVDRGGRLLGALSVSPIDHAARADDVLRGLIEVVRLRLAELPGEAHALAIAFPGPFDYENGVGRSRVKFASLYGVDLGSELRRRLDRPDLDVRFRNDAEAAVVAEAEHGAGRGYGRVLGVTLGTGLGAALVEGSRVVPLAAGIAAADLYRERVGGRLADDCFSARGLKGQFEEAGIDIRDLADAGARAHDEPETAAVFLEFGGRLGRFLAPRLSAVGAHVLVVAGGIAGSFHLFRETLQAEVAVPVLAGRLGPAAGVVGTAQLFA